jgi:hypothetical protein
VDPKEAQISLLRREVELLRQENTILKDHLMRSAPMPPATPNSGSQIGSLPTTPPDGVTAPGGALSMRSTRGSAGRGCCQPCVPPCAQLLGLTAILASG